MTNTRHTEFMIELMQALGAKAPDTTSFRDDIRAALLRDIEKIEQDIIAVEGSLKLINNTHPDYDMLYQVLRDKQDYHVNLLWIQGMDQDGGI